MIRALVLTLTIFLLAACSRQAMSERRIPDDVRAEVNANIDALIAGNTGFILDAFPDERNNPDFREQITRMANNVPDGAPVSRDLVAFQARTEQAYSDTQGAVRTGAYTMTHELAYDTGFLLIRTAHTFDETGECCVLRAINASRHDTSPVKAQLDRQTRIFKFLGIFLIVSTLITIIIFVIRVGGRKARQAQMGDGNT